MSSDNSKAYEFLVGYLEYYDDKSKLNKKWYSILIGINILISSFIPFISMFFDDFYSTKYIVSLMSCFVTAASTFRITYGFHENWIEYRTTFEILVYHKYLYESKSAPYKDNTRDEILISNVNAIVISENKTWRSYRFNKNHITPNQNIE